MSEKYDIQVGDRVTYTLFGKKATKLIAGDEEINLIENDIKQDAIEILKIDRPKYEKVYGKQEILDEAEKEYLSNVI